ncbi:MAG: YqhA family protein [Thermomicrobiales bacterium]
MSDANGPEFAIIGRSRFLIGIAIVGTMLSATTLMIFGFIIVLKTIWETFTDSQYDVEAAKHLSVVFIELTDLFLFAMVLYVVSIGMYQLFINPDVKIPAWMHVSDLADLKTQLINVIVVLLAVSFLAIATTWTSDRSILYFGAAVGIVILSLAGFNVAHHRMTHDSASDKRSGESTWE